MARKTDVAAKQAKLEKDAGTIVTGYATQDFTDGAGDFHKKGELTELTRDEYNRTKRHRLIERKDVFEARAKLEQLETEQRRKLSDQLNGLESDEDEDEEGEPTTTRAPRAAASSGTASSKRAKSARRKTA